MLYIGYSLTSRGSSPLPRGVLFPQGVPFFAIVHFCFFGGLCRAHKGPPHLDVPLPLVVVPALPKHFIDLLSCFACLCMRLAVRAYL